MKIDFDRLDALIKETGKKKNYLCGLLGRGEYYIRDARNKNIDIPAEYVAIWADELSTTVDYLQGYTDVKEKPTAGAVSFEDVVKAVKSMDREQLVKLAIIIAQEQGER
jgi:hypothetical protein